jgi:PHP family Zn ribbon phosphoesterase
MNHSHTVLSRKGLLDESGPPACPVCGHRLEFGSDRMGRTTQSCACGHRAHVGVRYRARTLADGSPS